MDGDDDDMRTKVSNNLPWLLVTITVREKERKRKECLERHKKQISNVVLRDVEGGREGEMEGKSGR